MKIRKNRDTSRISLLLIRRNRKDPIFAFGNEVSPSVSASLYILYVRTQVNDEQIER